MIQKYLGLAFRYGALAAGIWHIYCAFVGVNEPYSNRATHLAIFMALFFLSFLQRHLEEGKKTAACIDGVMCLFSCAMIFYILTQTQRLVNRIPIVGDIEVVDVVFAIFTVVAVMIAVKRKIGWVMVIICGSLMAYAYFGPYMPGMFQHKGLSLKRTVDVLFMGTEGFFGSPLNVTSRYIVLFVLFGCLLSRSGASEFINNFANSLVGSSRGGAAKVAAVSSAMFGMISGAPTANVVTTGAFTIPMMKKIGYKPVFAGAVEAVASAGGAITPPIMGSTVFLLAEILSIPYSEVAWRCILPSILYYIALLRMIDLEAVKLGLSGMPKDQLPRVRDSLHGAYAFIIPFTVLVVLMIKGYTTTMAGLWGVVSILVINLFSKKMTLSEIISGFEDAIRNAMTIVMACAAAGIIIGMFQFSGLSGKFTAVILSFSGGRLFPALLLIMITCLILGMGIPITGSYILLSALAGPALISMGVMPLSAHMFIFYFAVVSVLTPPVATAAYAAAGLSGASPISTGWMAMRLGITGYLVPFIIVYEPALLLYGNPLDVIWATVTAIVGVIFLASAVQGYFFYKTSLLERIFFGVGSVLMIYPGLVTDLIGAGIVAVLLFMQFKNAKIRKQVLVS